MLIKLLLFGFAIVFADLCGGQIQERKWSLEQCVNYAKHNNINLKRFAIKRESARIDYEQTKLNQWPTSNLSSSLNSQFGRSLNRTTYTYTQQQLLAQDLQLSGSLTLYNFKKLQYQKKSKQLASKAAEADFYKSFFELKVEILQQYLKTLLSKEQINIAMTAVGQTKFQLEIAKRQLSVGANSELSVIQMQVRLMSDSLKLMANIEEYQNNLISLKTELNIKLDEPFDIQELDTANIFRFNVNILKPETVYNLARKGLLKLDSDSIKIAAAKMAVKAAKSSKYPELSLNYSLASSFSNYIQAKPVYMWFDKYGNQVGRNFNQQIALTLAVPIMNNGKHSSAYETAKLQEDDVQMSKDATDNELRKSVYQLCLSAKAALLKLNSTKRLVENMSKAYAIYLTGYELGGMTDLDLAAAHAALEKINIDLVTSKYDLLFKIKLLEYYMDL